MNSNQLSNRRQPRRAFTLIELLVVIAILSLVISLALMGVMIVYGQQAVLQTRNEISVFMLGVGNFKKTYGIYPPHYFRARSYLSDYLASKDPRDADSLKVILKMFPDIGDFGSDPIKQPPIAWNGLAPYAPGEFEDLGPDQTPVFFLGGIPSGGSCAGFSTNPKDPANLATLTKPSARKGRLVEFETSRLFKVGTSHFYSYKDPFGEQPYLMFSSTHGYGQSNPMVSGGFFVNGSAIKIRPFHEAPGRFVNSQSIQWVSAGRDRVFGPGGNWSAATATNYIGAGADDLANFHPNVLSIP